MRIFPGMDGLPRGMSEVRRREDDDDGEEMEILGDEGLLAALNEDLRDLGGLTLRFGNGSTREMMPGDVERYHSEEERLEALDRLVLAAGSVC